MHGEVGWGLEESHCELGPAHLTSRGVLLPGLELRLGAEYLCQEVPHEAPVTEIQTCGRASG